jgi:hypothetical protein
MTFRNIIIRCELYVDEVDEGKKFVAVATSKVPAIYKGAQVEFQFALFKTRGNANQDAVLYDISEFAGLPELRVRSSGVSGGIIMDDTATGAVIEKFDCTLAEWQAGTNCHFRFYFPETATGLAAGTHFLVVFGPDGDVFGISDVVVVDPGTGAASSPAPSAAGYYTKPEVIGLLEDKLDKQLAEDQPLVFYALNPVTGEHARITLQPVFDENGPRLIHIPEIIV